MLTTGSTPENPQHKSVSLGTLLLMLILAASIIALVSLLYTQRSNQETAMMEKEEVPQTAYGEPPSFLYSLYGSTSGHLRSPMGVYVDQGGRIYVASTNSHQVQVFTPMGKYEFSFGKQGSRPGEFSFPYGITALDTGNLLISETGNGRIQEFTPGGRYVGQWAGQGSNIKVKKPGPLKVREGILYIGDLVSQQVKVVNLKSGGQRLVDKQFYPHGVGIDSSGKVYVANAGTYNVKIFDPQGQAIGTIPKAGNPQAFDLLRGLAVDSQDRIYAVDSLACQIKVFHPGGQLLFTFGSKGSGNGELFYPTGIFIDSKDRIYIADWGNNRVCVWDYRKG
ncbi:MAG TPA: 6-bladed beta-propeller [Bacillota bacterium]|nr:6-bladed beta-propeller [Bacillota bacterium]